MRSSFFEFNVAISGLFVARGGLETVSHNISNASTVGYSRQYIQQGASTPLALYNGKGMVGTGAEIYGIGQVRSFYLDTKYWKESAVLGEYSTKQAQLSLTESIFNSLGTTGLNGLYDNFFSSIQDLSTNAGDATYRTSVIQSAATLATSINTSMSALHKQQIDVNAEVKSMVTIINSLATQICSLNQQIDKYELDGSNANDLRDQRARLVDELSSYVNVEVKEEETALETRYSVLINGEELVSHYQVFTLRVEERSERLNTYDASGLYDIYFNGSNKKLDLHNSTLQGELKGLIDIRDGNNADYFNTTYNSNTKITAVGANSITISNPNTVDLNTSGYMDFINPLTGAKTTLVYNNMIKNTDGSVTFEFDSSNTLPTYAATANISIGKATSYKGIPHYINKLNEMVRTVAQALNEGLDRSGNPIEGLTGHANGYNQAGETGILFFTYDPQDGTATQKSIDAGNPFNYYALNAGNFIVNPDLIKSPSKLATNTTSNLDESENTIVLEFLTLNSFRGLFDEGKLSDFLIGMSGELGIDVKQATNFTLNYTDVVSSIDNQRVSVSGVDINEEIVSLIQYQQLYQAAARLVNVINEVYDTMINRLGV